MLRVSLKITDPLTLGNLTFPLTFLTYIPFFLCTSSLGYGESDETPVFGHNSILPKEHGGKFFNLPIIRYLDSEVGAVATWDSSIHDSLCLNRVTPGK